MAGKPKSFPKPKPKPEPPKKVRLNKYGLPEGSELYPDERSLKQSPNPFRRITE